MCAQRLVRLKAEMNMMTKNPAPGIHTWLKEENSDVVMVEMHGPEGSPYENGIFLLEVVLSDRYPFTPPNIRFITPVYHPNIDPSCRICLTALKPKPTGTWAVNLNIATVLSAIRILLAEPNLSDPLMADIAKEYAENNECYRNTAKSETLKHAKRKECGGVAKVINAGSKEKEDELQGQNRDTVEKNAEASSENAAKKRRVE